MCPIWHGVSIGRDGKWAVSYEVSNQLYQSISTRDQSQDVSASVGVFPDYCTGYLWITSPGTARDLARHWDIFHPKFQSNS